MPKGYHHLTKFERCQIEVLMNRGDLPKDIAEAINVHVTTVKREIKRNSGSIGYRYIQAHKKSLERRKNASQDRSKITESVITYIVEKLLLQWSPEQISGRLKLEKNISISHETIYQLIWLEKSIGGKLYKNLRHQGKKYNKRSKGKAGRGCIPNRVDIDKRPSIVEEKSRLGDWELDTIIGAGKKGGIVSIVDRASKLTKLQVVSRKTSIEVQEAIVKSLLPIKNFVKTLTSDNGKEFSRHEHVSKELESGFYFAKPYHSWERGLNEHTNGLIRQYFPKGMKFKGITNNELQKVEDLLNNRPRKVLEFKTPIEVFDHLSKKSYNCALQT